MFCPRPRRVHHAIWATKSKSLITYLAQYNTSSLQRAFPLRESNLVSLESSDCSNSAGQNIDQKYLIKGKLHTCFNDHKYVIFDIKYKF